MLLYDKVSFDIDSQKIINDVNIVFKEKELVTVSGDNGAGKSTLLNLLYKRQKLKSGNIFLGDNKIDKICSKDFYKDVVMLTQDPKQSLFSGFTIKEHLKLLGGGDYKRAASKIKGYVNFNLLGKLHLNVDSLSGGQRQTFAFALIMLKKPKVLLLDEHTSALDPRSAEIMMQTTNFSVKENNMVGIMIAHNLNLAEKYSDKVITMDKGKIM